MLRDSARLWPWLRRLRSGALCGVAAAVILGDAGRARAQLFAPPSTPTPGASAVRGLYDPNAAPDITRAPGTGVDGAPAATFEPPVQGTPDEMLMPGADPPPATEPISPVVESNPLPIDGAEVIARIDGEVILASDILWQVNQLIAMANKKQPIPPEQIPIAQKALTERLLLGLIDTKLLYADFRRTVPAENLPKIESSITEPFENIEVPRLVEMMELKDRTQLDAALRRYGTSLKDVQRQFTEKTIAGEWLKQRLPKAEAIGYEALLAYYQDHPKEFEIVASVDWEELVVRFDRCGGDRNVAWQQICAMGNEAWQAATASPNVRGAVFAAVAKAQSHGVTAASGGLYTGTTAGALKCEALNQALATLQVGQFSDGIESDIGFHIVRVLKRVEAGRRPFEEAQSDIRKLLEAEQRSAGVANELKELRTACRVWTTFHGDLNGPQVSELLDANDAKRR